MEIHIQEIQAFNLKSIVNFLKFMGKVLYATADMVTTCMTQIRLNNLNANLTKDIDDNL